jgi:hypothetical protein
LRSGVRRQDRAHAHGQVWIGTRGVRLSVPVTQSQLDLLRPCPGAAHALARRRSSSRAARAKPRSSSRRPTRASRCDVPRRPARSAGWWRWRAGG